MISLTSSSSRAASCWQVLLVAAGSGKVSIFGGFLCYVLGTKLGVVLLFRMFRKGCLAVCFLLWRLFDCSSTTAAPQQQQQPPAAAPAAGSSRVQQAAAGRQPQPSVAWCFGVARGTFWKPAAAVALFLARSRRDVNIGWIGLDSISRRILAG